MVEGLWNRGYISVSNFITPIMKDSIVGDDGEFLF
jgi:hypothetical protein